MANPERGAGQSGVAGVPFTAVKLSDEFWAPRLEINRRMTIPFAFQKCEETGRIANFEIAGGLVEGKHQGKRYNDSDVFKGVEAAAYSLSTHPDPELDAYLDALIAKIAAAQEKDGYLYTARTCDPQNPAEYSGAERWSYLRMSHELYNVGHLYEAAAAHFQATGKRSLLDVALRNADLVAAVFGPDRQRDVPGHQEIELGLVKLYRITGERRYLELARFFLAERGHPNGRTLYGRYVQDHAPVLDQAEALGHAVRAVYMYTAMAEVGALTGDTDLLDAAQRLWEDVVNHKLFLTGGIGSRRGNEGFDRADHLPNARSYNETCAAIANALWNHRMFLAHADARYLDVFERIAYNGLISGVALSGDAFFYPNPLESDGRWGFNYGDPVRRPWFDCSCCPQNVARFLASFPGYLYAQRGGELFVNLYARSHAGIDVGGVRIAIHQQTRYPWDGRIALELEPARPLEMDLRLRIPGWARGAPVPGDLYSYEPAQAEAVQLRVNGETQPVALESGFARLRRTWQRGDRVELELPMPIRRVRAHERVAEDRGRVALERGPIVYCVEEADCGRSVASLHLPAESPLQSEHRPELLGGCTVLSGTARGLDRGPDEESVNERPVEFRAVPYHLWAHRGAGEMAVWLPAASALARPVPYPSLATRSAVQVSFQRAGREAGLDPGALRDQVPPRESSDRDVARLHWWPRRGSGEWVQYDFPALTEIHAVEVFWFVDRRPGGCRLPESWRLRFKDGDSWLEVDAHGHYGLEADAYNRTAFAAVRTRALRLEVQSRAGASAGILEWRVF